MAEFGEGFRPIDYYTINKPYQLFSAFSSDPLSEDAIFDFITGSKIDIVTIEELRRRGPQGRTGEAWSEPIDEDHFEMFIGGSDREVSLIHELTHLIYRAGGWAPYSADAHRMEDMIERAAAQFVETHPAFCRDVHNLLMRKNKLRYLQT